jgi:hypothetical protein
MAGAAVRPRRGAVGINTDHLGFDIRNAIRAGDRKPGIDRGHARSHTQSISSEIGDETRPQADDPAVAPGCEFGILDLVASMRGREKAFAASFGPGTGAAGAHRQERANDVLSIKTELGPKSATDVGSDKPQLVKRQRKALAQGSGVSVRQLADV